MRDSDAPHNSMFHLIVYSNYALCQAALSYVPLKNENSNTWLKKGGMVTSIN